MVHCAIGEPLKMQHLDYNGLAAYSMNNQACMLCQCLLDLGWRAHATRAPLDLPLLD